MAGPWEQYQNQEAGPWSKYAPAEAASPPTSTNSISNLFSKGKNIVTKAISDYGTPDANLNLFSEPTQKQSENLSRESGALLTDLFTMTGAPIAGLGDILGTVAGGGSIDDATKEFMKRQENVSEGTKELFLKTPEQKKHVENVRNVVGWIPQKAGAGNAAIIQGVSDSITGREGTLDEMDKIIKGESAGTNPIVPLANIFGQISALGAMSGGGDLAVKGVKGIIPPKVDVDVAPPPGASPTASISPEVPRQVHPEYVKGAFPLPKQQALPVPENITAGGSPFKPSPPKMILKKGEPLWTEGKVNPDLEVEYKPVFNRAGKPYKTENSATLAMNKKGFSETHEVVPYEKGFAIKRKTGTETPEAPVAEAPSPEGKPPILPMAGAQEIQKTPIEQKGKYNVVQVDGDYVRKNVNEEFTDFGHKGNISQIPENELWIDKGLKPDEIPIAVDRMIAERKALDRGLSTKNAFDYGEKVEKSEREKSDIGKVVKNETDEKVISDATKEDFGSVGNVNIKIVDGDLLRDKFKTDYTEGGHDKVYPWVPKDTVLIDSQVSPAERPYIIAHELHERNLMEQGMKYDEAHKQSSAYEHDLREHPEKLQGAPELQFKPSIPSEKDTVDFTLHTMKDLLNAGEAGTTVEVGDSGLLNTTGRFSSHVDWARDIMSKHKTDSKNLINIINKYLAKGEESLTEKQSKIFEDVRREALKESNNPVTQEYIKALKGETDGTVNELKSKGVGAGEIKDYRGDVEKALGEKGKLEAELSPAAIERNAKDVSDFFEEMAKQAEVEKPAEEPPPEPIRTEQTPAGDQATIPDASEAETFSLTNQETEWSGNLSEQPAVKTEDLFEPEKKGVTLFSGIDPISAWNSINGITADADKALKDHFDFLKQSNRIVEPYRPATFRYRLPERQESGIPGTEPKLISDKDMSMWQRPLSPNTAMRSFFSLKDDPVIDAIKSVMTYYENVRNHTAFSKYTLKDIPDELNKIVKDVKPLFDENKPLLDKWENLQDQKLYINRRLSKIPENNEYQRLRLDRDKLQTKIRQEQKAMDSVKTEAAKKRHQVIIDRYNKMLDRRDAKIDAIFNRLKTVRDYEDLGRQLEDINLREKALTPEFDEMGRKFDAQLGGIAEKYADARVYLKASGDLPDGIKLSAEEEKAASQLQKYMESTRDKLEEQGIPVIQGKGYMTHLWKQLIEDDSVGIRKKFKEKPTLLRFMSRLPNSRPWIPSANGAMEAYIPAAEYKLAMQPFLDRWRPFVDTLQQPALRRYMEDWMDKNLTRQDLSAGDKALNAAVAFEYARTIGLSVSTATKHGMKMLGTPAEYGLMPAAKGVKEMMVVPFQSGTDMIEANFPKMKPILEKMGINGEKQQLRVFRHYVNQSDLIRMMSEIPGIDGMDRDIFSSPNMQAVRKGGKFVVATAKKILSQPVKTVEAFENGVSVMAGLIKGASKDIPQDVIERQIWKSILDVNLRGGVDQPLYQKNTLARGVTMFQMTLQKLQERLWKWGHDAFVYNKDPETGKVTIGQRDAFGTHGGAKLARMLLLVGAAETIARENNTSILGIALAHVPFFGELIEPTSSKLLGYELKEPQPNASPIIQAIYELSKQGTIEGTKTHLQEGMQSVTKLGRAEEGKLPERYETPTKYILGLQKTGTSAENMVRDITSKRVPLLPRSAEDRDRAALRSKYIRQINEIALNDKLTPEELDAKREAIRDGIAKDIEDKKLTQSDLKKIGRNFGKTELERHFASQEITVPDAIKIWKVATPEEKMKLIKPFINKMRILAKNNPNDFAKYQPDLEKIREDFSEVIEKNEEIKKGLKDQLSEEAVPEDSIHD